MTGYQLVIIGLIGCIAILDGFDAFAMAFVAPVVGREWGLGSAVLGVLLSSGFAGMALGSFFIAPLADARGRRPVVLGCMIPIVAGALLSAAAQSVAVLVASRVVTGLGLGALVSLTTSIASEFSSARYRAFIVATVAQGFPLGNILCGLTSAALLKSLGWRSVFLSGGLAGLVLVTVLAVLLLESPSYLIARQTSDSLPRLNRVLSRLGHGAMAALPSAPTAARASYRALFVPGLARITVQLVLVDVLLMMSSFYLLSWLPQFITGSGLTPASASIVAAMTASSGVVGGLLIGALAVLIKPARLAAVSMIMAGVFMAAIGAIVGGVLGTPMADLSWLTGSAMVFGFFLAGATGVLYALMAEAFPPLARTSGMGLVLGAGRISGALGPGLAGWMFAAGLGRWPVSAMFALGPIAAGVILLGIKTRADRR